MNIRDLSYLVALAEHKHFGKAADACYVSQPALSMQIKKLETLLGVQLIERSNKSFLLTQIGIVLAEKARQVLQQAEEIKYLAKASQDPFSGDIKIGIIPTLAPYLLPLISSKLNKEFKQLKIFLIEDKTETLLEKLQQGKIDTALLATPISHLMLEQIPLFKEEFFLAAEKQHTLAKYKTISLEKIKHENILLLEEGHCLRHQALQICKHLPLKEYANFSATSLETLRQMVASGIGITFIPALAAQKKDGLQYISLKSEKPYREISLVWRLQCAKSKLLNSLAQVTKNILAKDERIQIL